MDIEDAVRLEPGMKVRCPEDRGEPGFTGTVVDAPGPDGKPSLDLLGHPYVWVGVRNGAHGHVSIWPSNRLEAVTPIPRHDEEAPGF